MLDIHTHMLPGMDDGSRSVEQSLAMLALEAEQGIDTVAMTPHFLADREGPEQFLARRYAAEEKLRSALADKPGMPKILCGAEVAFFEGLSRAEGIDALCIGDSRVMLVEMPFSKWNPRILNELTELRQVRGIQPVLAHVERYRSFVPDAVIDQLRDEGMWIQVNTSFFLHWQTARKAMARLKKREIHFIATDSHNLLKRPPNLGSVLEKVEKKLGAQTMAYLETTSAMVTGDMR